MSRPTQALRRFGGMLVLAGLAAVVLSSCMNVNYTLVANPDATVSGTLQLQVAKEAASMLGIATAEDLESQLKSGELTQGGQSQDPRQLRAGIGRHLHHLELQRHERTAHRY